MPYPENSPRLADKSAYIERRSFKTAASSVGTVALATANLVADTLPLERCNRLNVRPSVGQMPEEDLNTFDVVLDAAHIDVLLGSLSNPGVDSREVAKKLIKADEAWAVADFIEKFNNLDQEIAMLLIDDGYGRSVAENLESFVGLNHQEIVDRLLQIDKYGNLTLGGNAVADNLEKFIGIDHELVAFNLIAAGYGGSVANNINKFQGVNLQQIAKILIEEGCGWHLVKNLEKFENIDTTEIACWLVLAGEGIFVIDNLKKFILIDQLWVVEYALENHLPNQIISNLDKFTDLNQQLIAEKLIEHDCGWALAASIGAFDKSSDFVQKVEHLVQAYDLPDTDLRYGQERRKAVSDNLYYFLSLEKAVPGITQYLEEQLGVVEFARYPLALLLDQYESKDDTESPYGILMYPRSDFNSAFMAGKDALCGLFKQLKQLGYNLRICEIDGLGGAARNLIKLDKKYGQKHKISFAVIGGHGTPNSVSFGNDNPYAHLLTSNLKGAGVQKALGPEYFIKDPTIVFISCSTGVKEGIGQKTSEVTKSKTIAPDKQTNIGSFNVIKTLSGRLRIKVKYDDEDTEVTFSNGRSKTSLQRKYKTAKVATRQITTRLREDGYQLINDYIK